MTDGWVMDEIESQDNPYEGYEEAMNQAALNDLKREYPHLSADVVRGVLAKQDRDMLFREIHAARETIERICLTLMELGGWEEIDGDDDEASIIVKHIRELYHDERMRLDHMRKLVDDIREHHESDAGEEFCLADGFTYPCRTRRLIETFDEADL